MDDQIFRIRSMCQQVNPNCEVNDEGRNLGIIKVSFHFISEKAWEYRGDVTKALRAMPDSAVWDVLVSIASGGILLTGIVRGPVWLSTGPLS
jgi:hypothetical protein